MKNKFVLVLASILLFIPTVAAIFVYNAPPGSLVETPEIIDKCEITDGDGKLFEITDRAEIDMLAMLLRGDTVTSIPDQVLGYKTMTLKMIADGQSDSFQVYASGNHADSVYFKSPNNEFGKGNPVAVNDFLSSEYCISLYTVTPPMLTVGDVTVTPKTVDWKYKQANGSYLSYPVQTTQDVVDVGEREQDLGIEFSAEPDVAYITVYDDGVEQVTRVLSEFDGVKTAEKKRFTFTISAEWNGDGDSRGKAEYAFSATVKADAVFNIWTLSTEHTDMLYADQGGVVILGAKNADLSKISIEVSPKPMTADFTPVFYGDGDNAYAVVPSTYDTEPGKYDITVKYKDKAHTFTVEIKEWEFGKKYYGIKKDEAERIFSDENISSLQAIIKTVSELPTSNAYLGTDKFGFPGDVTRHRTGYGITMYIEELEREYRHSGIDIKADKGDDIYATTDGTVVYVGSHEITGGIIVLDHGLGVRSWYYRVATEGVAVGTEYKAGDKITEADESGFGDEERAHLSVTVGDQFVSPLWLIENGFKLPGM